LASVTKISKREDLLEEWQEGGGNVSQDVLSSIIQHLGTLDTDNDDIELEILAKRKSFLCEQRLRLLALEDNSDNISKESLNKIVKGNYTSDIKEWAQKQLDSLDTPFSRPSGAILTLMEVTLGKDSKLSKNALLDSKAVIGKTLEFYRGPKRT
jgi:hypothetical protein